jgi:hypothetical protein
MRVSALVCLAATTASALTRPHLAALALAAPHGRCRRSGKLFAQQLAPGWAAAVDEGRGQTYYFHEETGHSQWEPPQAVAPQAVASQVLWVVAPFEGVRPEFRLRNGEEQVLGRSDMVEENPYVSRAQCLVRVSPDGTATAVALGKAQTYVLKPSAKCSVVLRKDEEHVLGHSDQIALNIGANRGIFTVYALQGEDAQNYGRSAPQGAQESGHAQHGQPQLPAPWEQLIDPSTGAAYYYNGQTGESSWEPPQGGYGHGY